MFYWVCLCVCVCACCVCPRPLRVHTLVRLVACAIGLRVFLHLQFWSILRSLCDPVRAQLFVFVCNFLCACFCNCFATVYMYVCLYRFVCFFGWNSLRMSVHVNYSQVCVYGQLFLSLGLCASEFIACLCACTTVCLPLCTGIVLCAPVRVGLLDRFCARSSFVRAWACAQFVSPCQLCFCLSPHRCRQPVLWQRRCWLPCPIAYS